MMINERLFQQVCADVKQAGQRISQRSFARAVVGRYLEQMDVALADMRFGTESVLSFDDESADLIQLVPNESAVLSFDDKDADLIALSGDAARLK